MKAFNNLIHQPVRLQIMSALHALESGESVDFSFLKKLLGLTDGNLGAHLEKLEQAGYLDVEKPFVGKKPKTFLKATDQGRAAYQEHRSVLEKLLNGLSA